MSLALVVWQSDHITAVGEQAPVELSDNSRVILNTQSALAVDFSRDERRVRLLKGEAWFDIASDPSRPFIVETAQGRVEVTGTQPQGQRCVLHHRPGCRPGTDHQYPAG